MEFNADEIDLSDTNADGTPPLSNPIAQEGVYDVTCTEASFGPTKKGTGMMLTVVLSDADKRTVMHRFNVVNDNPVAANIGKAQLKAFLIHAGHHDPDHPGPIEGIKGLMAKVRVSMGEPFKRKSPPYEEVRYPEIKAFLPLTASA